MPCGDPGRAADDAAEQRERLRQATQAACEMGGLLRTHSLFGKLTKNTQAWLLRHDREDQERLKREKEMAAISNSAREKVLAKLTVAERAALGLPRS